MNSELFKRIVSSIVLIIVLSLIISLGTFYFNIFLAICFIFVLYEWHMISKNKKYLYLGSIFLIFSFYSVYKLYHLDNNQINFLLILLICVSTDVGGYVFGKVFKGPKLTKISPKKTYAGVIGGYLLTIISVNFLFQIQFFFPSKQEINFSILFLIILISTVSQLGDILISYFKRISNVKNTGKIIPGHGGLLDRVDGMIFSFPVYYVILLFNLSKEF